MSKKEKKMTFRFVGIELLGVQIIHPNNPELNLDEFSFNIEIKAGVSKEEKKVIVSTNVETQNKDKSITLGNISVNCIFIIENFEELIILQKENANIPTYIIEVLNSLSYSTVRGIMWNEFKGTFLHNAVLPVIDPKLIKPKLNKK